MEPAFAAHMLDASPVGLLVVDATGTITYASPTVEDVTGYDTGEVVGTNIVIYLHPDAVTGLIDSVAYVVEYSSAVMGPVNLAFMHSDGDFRALEVYAANRYDDPVIGGLVVAVRDNTLQWGLNDALIAYTEGGATTDVMRVFCQALLGLPIRGRAAFIDPVDGHVIVDLRVPPSLFGPAPDGERPRPWQEAVAGGEPVLPGDLGDYDEALQDAVRDAGFATMWAVPVTAPGARESAACLWIARLEAGEPSINERSRLNVVARSAAMVLERDALLGELARSARTDALTGLANRAHLFREGVRESAEVTAAEEAGTDGDRVPVAVLYVDLDNFKPVNDAHGHAAGDAVLQEVASRLTEVCRKGDEVGRVGGDEFVLVCHDIDEHGAAHVAERIVASMHRPIDVPVAPMPVGRARSSSTVAVTVGASVGVAWQEADGPAGLDELVRAADGAMYDAKRAGKGCWRIAVPA